MKLKYYDLKRNLSQINGNYEELAIDIPDMDVLWRFTTLAYIDSYPAPDGNYDDRLATRKAVVVDLTNLVQEYFSSVPLVQKYLLSGCTVSLAVARSAMNKTDSEDVDASCYLFISNRKAWEKKKEVTQKRLGLFLAYDTSAD